MELNDALRLVRDRLRDGTLVHVADFDDHPLGQVFNMSSACERGDCGTAACIGGWAALFMGMTATKADKFVIDVETRNPARPLFYPETDVERWNEITAEQAAQAIDNYLNTGEPSWHTIVK